MAALLEHRLETGRECEHALAGAGGATERHDADRLVGEQVDGDALFGGASAHVEQRAVASHEVQSLVGVHACDGRLRTGVQDDTGVARQFTRSRIVDPTLVEQFVDEAALDVELDHARP